MLFLSEPLGHCLVRLLPVAVEVNTNCIQSLHFFISISNIYFYLIIVLFFYFQQIGIFKFIFMKSSQLLSIIPLKKVDFKHIIYFNHNEGCSSICCCYMSHNCHKNWPNIREEVSFYYYSACVLRNWYFCDEAVTHFVTLLVMLHHICLPSMSCERSVIEVFICHTVVTQCDYM